MCTQATIDGMLSGRDGFTVVQVSVCTELQAPVSLSPMGSRECCCDGSTGLVRAGGEGAAPGWADGGGDTSEPADRHAVRCSLPWKLLLCVALWWCDMFCRSWLYEAALPGLQVPAPATPMHIPHTYVILQGIAVICECHR